MTIADCWLVAEYFSVKKHFAIPRSALFFQEPTAKICSICGQLVSFTNLWLMDGLEDHFPREPLLARSVD
jgi:hypothetical protein